MPNTSPLSAAFVDDRHFERALRPIDGSKRGVEIEQAVGLEVVGRAGGGEPRLRGCVEGDRSGSTVGRAAAASTWPPRQSNSSVHGPRVPSSVLVSGR